MKIDATDAKILKYLQKDAKVTIKQMADWLHLTPTPVYERIKRLEKNGVIKNYVAIINPKSVDRAILVVVNISMNNHALDVRERFIMALSKFTEIQELLNTAGTHDYIAKGRFSGIEHYREFLVNKLSTIDGIKDIDSHIVLKEIKNTTAINF
ncbi:MAG: Lrp/AsnC family transcriptional regulator [Bacteroidia bacterium]